MAPTYNANLANHYKIFRDYLQHEDDLINQRSTWHHTIQGLLFAALGITVSKLDPAASREAAPLQKTLIVVLPILGILISLAAVASISAATRALDSLGDQWKEIGRAYTDNPWPMLPCLAGAGSKHAIRYGKVPAYMIPGLIGVAWLTLLGVALWYML